VDKIEVLGKFSLEKKDWYNDLESRKISLSLANYDEIKNIDSDSYNYIIYSYGSRLEDHSPDGFNIKNNQANVDKILNYYNGKNCNIKVKFIMLDKDAPLREDGILLAQYINNLCLDSKCNSINIIAYSKSGVMFFDMIKYLNHECYKKINLYNVATPYTGTKMASPKFIYKDIETFINSHIFNEYLSNKVYNALISFYESISSNSHMDYDIALPGGVLDDRLDKYDESFIRSLLVDDNISVIKMLNRFSNYTTGIDDSTLRRALRTCNFNGVGMCLINDILMGKNSDGFVHTLSEEEISKYINVDNKYIKGAHHDLTSDSLYFNQVLSDMCDDILEDNEKKLIRKLY
jgi:hypothetical protein